MLKINCTIQKSDDILTAVTLLRSFKNKNKTKSGTHF